MKLHRTGALMTPNAEAIALAPATWNAKAILDVPATAVSTKLYKNLHTHVIKIPNAEEIVRARLPDGAMATQNAEIIEMLCSYLWAASVIIY